MLCSDFAPFNEGAARNASGGFAYSQRALDCTDILPLPTRHTTHPMIKKDNGAAPLKVAVLGGGSFGTALANIVADNGHDVVLWLRNNERAAEINQHHRNSVYLPDYPLNPSLLASVELAEAVADRDVVFMAVPSASCRAVAKEVARYIRADCMLVSTTKGLEASDTPQPHSFRLMSEVLREELPALRLGVLSGPNLAKEIAAKQITATVIASADEQLNTAA